MSRKWDDVVAQLPRIRQEVRAIAGDLQAQTVDDVVSDACVELYRRLTGSAAVGSVAQHARWSAQEALRRQARRAQVTPQPEPAALGGASAFLPPGPPACHWCRKPVSRRRRGRFACYACTYKHDAGFREEIKRAARERYRRKRAERNTA